MPSVRLRRLSSLFAIVTAVAASAACSSDDDSGTGSGGDTSNGGDANGDGNGADGSAGGSGSNRDDGGTAGDGQTSTGGGGTTPSGGSTATHFASSGATWTLPVAGNFDALSGDDPNDPNGYVWSTTDVDGDGKVDLLVTGTSASGGGVLGGTSAPYWSAHLGSGTGFATAKTVYTLPVTGTNAYAPSGGDATPGKLAWTYLDVNGDGRGDFVTTASWVSMDAGTSDGENDGSFVVLGGASAPYWNVYLAGASGFASTAVKWTFPLAGVNAASITGSANDAAGAPSWTTTDLDGDGFVDLIVTGGWSTGSSGRPAQQVVLGGTGAPYWNVYRGSASGFSASADKWTLPLAGTNANALSGAGIDAGDQDYVTTDVDGDGKPDLVVLGAWDASVDAGAAGAGGDVVLGGSSAPYWNVYVNGGSGFASTAAKWTLPVGGNFTALSGHGQNTGDVAWSVADLDGDRHPDFVVTASWQSGAVVLGGTGAPYWDVYRGGAGGFASAPIKWTVPLTGTNVFALSGGAASSGALGWETRDMNGDSRADLVVTSVYTDDAGPEVGNGTSTPTWTIYLGEP